MTYESHHTHKRITWQIHWPCHDTEKSGRQVAQHRIAHSIAHTNAIIYIYVCIYIYVYIYTHMRIPTPALGRRLHHIHITPALGRCDTNVMQTSRPIIHSATRSYVPPKNGRTALWPNTRVVKCKYYVSQKQNGSNIETHWYCILLTFIFKFTARL